ncbi:MAG: pyruvate, phosphate dikinase [Candidatus Shapirobacteria bacterium]|nr:pyruvate, phosphate dikinase [Candidatus Shapirobacteria bacterium]
MTTWVYSFKEATGKKKELLGGKGAGLAQMTKIGLPVPPGFVITTKTCLQYLKNKKIPSQMWEQVLVNLAKIEKETGKGFGDSGNPLLVSVRSGAVISMPGMMDTVLNLGLNKETLKGLITKTGNERFALDAYRRFIQMFANIVMEVPLEKFEAFLDSERKRLKIKDDTQFKARDLKKIIDHYLVIFQKETGQTFPQDPQKQLRAAIKAVFDSWNNKRAIDYRNFNKIPHDLGTAVNVQTMVFGNMGDSSGTGVAFTRNPATGEKKLYGEFLVNAQGEDVVAGIRTPRPIKELEGVWPKIFGQINRIAKNLERHYRDTQDLEFTIEEGKLWLLQTRSGKRTAQAAINIAYDMVKEGLIGQEEALMRIEPKQISQLLHTQIDPKAKIAVIAKGLAASPGAATGQVVFTADEAEKKGKAGQKVILVRPETSPDDVHGVLQAQGVLTARGGMTSHAAVVARGLGKPCVSGCETITIEVKKNHFRVGSETVKAGDVITINGSTGEVIAGNVPMIEPKISSKMKTLLAWADKVSKLNVWANADYPRDALAAVSFGAGGIGLCRTEHMFMEQERLPFVQDMILAVTETERVIPLKKLEQFQKRDFVGIFKAMKGKPVIIRLIDPPLHEFLPKEEEINQKIAQTKNKEEKDRWQKMLAALEKMAETNPMLGLRGCRLGIIMPDIVRMQTRAIIEAALKVKKTGQPVKFKIMVPLVGILEELKFVKNEILIETKKVFAQRGERINFEIGTMIELPRAALVADEIAQEAEFFSFGTNDLTQTTLGISRDDAEGKFLALYEDLGIIKTSPFQSLDQAGVGQLIILGVERGRKTRKNLSIGICGEHGGDPESIAFCHLAGLNYVSCSPYRVPVARIAAAQAAIREKQTE